jgi:predicted RNA-binding Zn-ribbon protein involved in translation (DUF1610 family)
MQGNWVKTGLVISVVITAVLVAGFLVETFRGAGGVPGVPPLWMVCTNPDCKAAYTLTQTEFQEISRDIPLRRPGFENPVFDCRQCGKKTLHRGYKCPKCGQAFVRAPDSEDYSDRCPACRYSPSEEYQKKRQKP